MQRPNSYTNDIGINGRANKNKLKSIRARDKALKAWQMRVSGAALRQIAEALDYRNTSRVVEALQMVWRETGKPRREEEVEAMLERMDGLILTFYPKARNGDDKAAEVVFKAENRRARLLGLDAPTKVTGADGGPVQIEISMIDAAAKVEAKLDELAARREARELAPAAEA